MLIIVKKIIHKLLGEKGQNFIVKLLIKFKLNNKYILFTGRKAVKNTVNLNYCHDFKNLGDNISPVIVRYVLEINGLDINQEIHGTVHLYAIGSIITAGAQDCTIWGSGLLNTRILNRLSNRKLDIRAVRGPLTRAVLIDRGLDVPEVYGDPAILMPYIYNPKVRKKYPVSVITHVNAKVCLPDNSIHIIDIATDNYKKFIAEIKSSELVISSSLHGIIFAEVYGIRAVMLKPENDLFKYFDYYYSTMRFSFPIAETVEEALQVKPVMMPDFENMKKNLLKAFPVDLWTNSFEMERGKIQ